MARLILVCGPTGAGKTTYSIALSDEIGAIRFSIDQWMQTLFAKDMTSLDYAWLMDRVERFYGQIWDVSAQILGRGGSVVLDLGFTTRAQRAVFFGHAGQLDLSPEVHYLDAPRGVRKQRGDKRNLEKDPRLYAFEVTDMMFNFMEPMFEVPDAQELKNGLTVKA